MNIPILSDLFRTVGDGIKTWNEGRIRIKKAEIDAKVRILEMEGKAEADWDMAALKASQNSWKDEFLLIVWFTPFILLFIPEMQPYIVSGFNALSQVPYGYWLVLFGMVAQAFGLRWLFQKRVEKTIESVREFNK